MGILLEGDANNDNCINIQDFGVLASAYGAISGNSRFDDRADFDHNGVINISDCGLLAVNYGKFAPVEIP